MARCRHRLGWRVWALVAVWILAGVQVAHAANTSRPTGRGVIHDNSVYCQNSPGQPARPEYRGTGSQNVRRRMRARTGRAAATGRGGG
jgi:hypothetical protein